jgi:hypothetical protein
MIDLCSRLFLGTNWPFKVGCESLRNESQFLLSSGILNIIIHITHIGASDHRQRPKYHGNKNKSKDAWFKSNVTNLQIKFTNLMFISPYKMDL